MIRTGCCGFPLSHGRCFRSFDAVEVQATFYDPPRPETLVRWRQTAPAKFEFTLKAWQLVTHAASSPTYRRLRHPLPGPAEQYGGFQLSEGVQRAWAVTRQAARALAARWVVLQCPPSFAPTEEHVERLRRFCRTVDRSGLLLVWEPRGPWPADLVAGLCRELDLVHGVDPFATPPAVPGPCRYFRLHGRGGYRYRYSDAELLQLLAWCRAPGATDVYVLFNNTAMAEDAARFRALI